MDDTAIKAEDVYSINFSEQENKFCSSVHYNKTDSFLFVCLFVCLFFVNGVKIYQFKTKHTRLISYLLS